MNRPLRRSARPLARAAAVLLAALAFLPVAATAAGKGGTLIQLKREIVVDRDIVRLGDLFDGLGEKRETRIGSAPEPGERAVYSLQQIRLLARAHGLNWRPSAGRRHVVIRRAAHEVPRSAVQALIAERLDEHHPEQRFRLSIAGMNPPLLVAADAQPDLSLSRFDLDQKTGRFSARVRAEDSDGDVARTRVTGFARPVYQVLALEQPVARGQVVTANMVALRDVTQRSLSSDVLTHADQALGLAAKRALRPGQPLRAGDLQAPLVLRRGDVVSMVFSAPGIRLTTAARALEDGAVGDTVAISNLRSKRTVYAVVESASLVRVTTQRLDIAAVQNR